MQDPYEEYWRYERRRQRTVVAIVVGTVLMAVVGVSALAVAWRISAENQRIAAALDMTAPLR